MKVAKTFLDQGKKLNFAVANRNSFSHDVSEFGLDSGSEVPVVAIRTAKGDKYVMAEAFSWVQSFSSSCFPQIEGRTSHGVHHDRLVVLTMDSYFKRM